MSPPSRSVPTPPFWWNKISRTSALSFCLLLVDCYFCCCVWRWTNESMENFQETDAVGTAYFALWKSSHRWDGFFQTQQKITKEEWFRARSLSFIRSFARLYFEQLLQEEAKSRTGTISVCDSVSDTCSHPLARINALTTDVRHLDFSPFDQSFANTGWLLFLFVLFFMSFGVWSFVWSVWFRTSWFEIFANFRSRFSQCWGVVDLLISIEISLQIQRQVYRWIDQWSFVASSLISSTQWPIIVWFSTSSS